MFLAQCCLQRGRSALPTAGSTTFRRLLKSPGQRLSVLPRIVVGKANNWIESSTPEAIHRYFFATTRDVPLRVRREAGEALIDLFLRKRYFREAFKILELIRKMPKENAKLSAPIRAKVLTAQRIFGKVREEIYFHNIEALLRDKSLSEGEDAERHFMDVLHLLWLTNKPAKRLEKLAQLYMKIRGEQYRLNSTAIAFLIKSHVEEKREADAERWLSYHSTTVSPANVHDNPDFCLPYTALAHGLLLANPEKDAREVYQPILNRMAKDNAWPDAAFVNVLISADLKRGNFKTALELYDFLRAHVSHGVYPDETTYSGLFTSAAISHFTSTFTGNKEGPGGLWIVTPRRLFYEMAEIQLLIKKGHLKLIQPAVTKTSLGAALRCFITHKDYAAAIIVLKTFEMMHVPLEQPMMDLVIRSIVSRCWRDLVESITERNETTRMKGGKSWAQIFLDYRDVPTKMIRAVGEQELRKRVLNVTRRALLMSEKQEKSAMDQKEEAAKDDGERQGPQPSNIDKDSNDAETKAAGRRGRRQHDARVQVAEGDDTEHVRAQKKSAMREHRFRLIDVMLSRALEATVLLEEQNKVFLAQETEEVKDAQDTLDIAERGMQKLIEAATDMIPPVTKVTKRTLKRIRRPRSHGTSEQSRPKP